jgi:SEC-C motif domain protein
MTAAADGPCPCGRLDARKRPLLFALCCGPCLADFEGHPAADAEALMRSRYCAFVREDAAYLLATWDPGTRPPGVEFEPGLKWLGLEVRDHRVVDDSHAEVEFVARSRLGGRAHRLHERSRFVREDGRWYYVDGDLA